MFQALRFLVPKGDEIAFSTAVDVVQTYGGYAWTDHDSMWYILADLAPKGHERLIDSALAILAGRPDVESAWYVLRHVALQSDERILAVAANSLQHAGLGKSCPGAVATLMRFARKDDRIALEASLRHCECSTVLGNPILPNDDILRRDLRMRCTALTALRQIAQKGNERAIVAAIANLSDNRLETLQAAYRTLIRVAQRGDKRCVASLVTLLTHLEDQDYHVEGRYWRTFQERRCCRLRRSILTTLEWMADKGNDNVVSIADSSLYDCHASVRHASAALLARVAMPVDKLATLLYWLSVGHQWRTLDEPVLDALAQIVPTDDQDFFVEIMKLLEENAGTICKKAAAQLLGKIASEGDPCALRFLIKNLRDPDEEVHRTTADALIQLMPPPHGVSRHSQHR